MPNVHNSHCAQTCTHILLLIVLCASPAESSSSSLLGTAQEWKDLLLMTGKHTVLLHSLSCCSCVCRSWRCLFAGHWHCNWTVNTVDLTVYCAGKVCEHYCCSSVGGSVNQTHLSLLVLTKRKKRGDIHFSLMPRLFGLGPMLLLLMVLMMKFDDDQMNQEEKN